MSFVRWLRPLAARLNHTRARQVPPRSRVRPRVEGLEERAVPSAFTVTNTLDSGPGSLRQAILNVNAAEGFSVLNFNIPADDPGHVYYRDDGMNSQLTMANVAPVPLNTPDLDIPDLDRDGPTASWWTIRPASVLPAITKPVFIDGFSQPGAQAGQGGLLPIFRIELDGSRVLANDPVSGLRPGLTLAGGSSEVRGLVINRFIGGSGVGIEVTGAGDNYIHGNFIGTDISGSRLAGNPVANNLDPAVMWTGINVEGNSARNFVGTYDAELAVGNVICGTTAGVVFRGPGVENRSVGGHNVAGGNLVGVGGVWAGNPATYSDAGVTRLMGNAIGIATLLYAHDDQIGAGTPQSGQQGEENLISGNIVAGVVLGGGGNQIAGEYGGEVAGNTITHNAHAGIIVGIKSQNCLIAANEIAFNGLIGNTRIDNAPGISIFDLLGRGAPTGISVWSNSIHDNTGLGIDLGGTAPPPPYGLNTTGIAPDGPTPNDALDADTGPNNLQNYPVLLSAAVTSTSTAVAGTLAGTAGGIYRVEFFANSRPGHPNANDPTDPNRYGEGETFLGAWDVTIGADGTAYIIATDLAPVPPGGAYLTATATNEATGDTSEFSATLQVPAAGGGITLQATTQQAANDVMAAVNALSAPAQPVTITVDLVGGNFTGVTASPPANVTLVFENGTFNGHSPALTVTSGVVIVLNCTLTNSTDAPTILVTGGHLTLRNDMIQESTGFAQVAVLVAGGTTDLGTAADPGGNTFNVNGTGTLVRNDTATPVSTFGNTWEVNGVGATGPVVVKATPTVTVAGGSFVYDGQGHLASGSVTGVNGEDLGTPTFTYSYTDDNGNVVTSTSPPIDPGYYTVTASFAGNDNYAPASATATIMIAFEVRTLTDLSKALKAGRAIPIKIQLTDAAGNNDSSPGVNLTAVSLWRVNADGTRTQVTLQDAGGSNPDNLFRYDAALGGYVFNLSTKGLTAGTYAFDWVADGDPTEHELEFKLI
jgi:hypothetical protein